MAKRGRKNKKATQTPAEQDPASALAPSVLPRVQGQDSETTEAPAPGDVPQLRALIATGKTERKKAYSDDLFAAWDNIDRVKEHLAEKHGLAPKRVEQDLYTGRSLFKGQARHVQAWNAFASFKAAQLKEIHPNGEGKGALIKRVTDEEYQAEYHALTPEEKAVMVEKFKDIKESKAVVVRANHRTKVNDANAVFKRFMQEAEGLRQRTGVEVIIFATRGTTDLQWQNGFFATEGVKDFLDTVRNLDVQDILMRMEGYAIAGLQGAAVSYKSTAAGIRKAVREVIDLKLCEVTGKRNAKMEYIKYWKKVVERYHVVIVSWPSGLRFGNLSSAVTRQTDLRRLLAHWEEGKTHWKTISPAELKRLNAERASGKSSDPIAILDKGLPVVPGGTETQDGADGTAQGSKRNAEDGASTSTRLSKKQRTSAVSGRSQEVLTDTDSEDDEGPGKENLPNLTSTGRPPVDESTLGLPLMNGASAAGAILANSPSPLGGSLAPAVDGPMYTFDFSQPFAGVLPLDDQGAGPSNCSSSDLPEGELASLLQSLSAAQASVNAGSFEDVGHPIYNDYLPQEPNGFDPTLFAHLQSSH